MEKQQQIAVVTGSSTGIGYETSLLLARNGFYTFATMRVYQFLFHPIDTNLEITFYDLISMGQNVNELVTNLERFSMLY